MTEEMLGIKKTAENLGMSVRRVNQLCNEGKIKGARKIGGVWKIPEDSEDLKKIAEKRKIKHNQLMPLLPCPVGITSYREVSAECYYVDKTLMIKELIDSHNKVTLFTRPRRFGKTLTMDMIKTYFEKTDEDVSGYFSNRAIWSCSDSYKTYMGAYPVIFISFKDAHQNTWRDMYESLLMSIRGEYKRHMNVLESKLVSEIDKAFFKRMLSGKVSEVEAQASLGQLSHILSDSYDSRVIVIIDEYDTPIQQGYDNGYYNEVISFMRNLFSAVLKDNAALEFGILTGILRVAKESLFSGLNNLVVNTILDERYSEYFGFTLAEVREMAAYYGKPEKIEEISDWYDGYRFGKSEIFNPWSVIGYFNNNCIPKAFWSRTSGNDMILDVIKDGKPEIQDSLTRLLQGSHVKAFIDTDIIYPEIKSSEDAIYSFLMMTGYLKISEIVTDFDDNPVCNLLIPNKEIKMIFKKEILDNLSQTMNQSVIRNFQLALKTNNKEELQKTIREYLIMTTSYFDTAKESFYHGIMLGLLAIMSDDYRIMSNREAGEGRFDILMTPVSKTNPGIVMEFKVGGNADEKELEKLAEIAIKQIRDKKYATVFKTDEIADVRAYGIAFCKKKAVVKTIRLW